MASLYKSTVARQQNHCVCAHNSRGCVRDTRILGTRTVHFMVFAEFSEKSLKDRIANVQSTLVVTANEGLTEKKVMELKSIIDAAIADLFFVTTYVVFRHTDARTPVRNVWANDKAAKMRLYCLPEMTSWFLL